jgi:hypothetical protein
MSRYIYVVLSNAVEGREEDFNEWYDEHLEYMWEIEGFVAAQRFLAPQPDPSGGLTQRYLTLYEVETDDLAKVHAAMTEKVNTGEMVVSDALDLSTFASGYFIPISERITRPS